MNVGMMSSSDLSTIDVVLTPVEMEFGLVLAKMTQEDSERRGLTDRQAHPDSSKGLEIQIQGRRAELAVAKAFNVYFPAWIGAFKELGDVGNLEVRYVRRVGGKMVVRPRDIYTGVRDVWGCNWKADLDKARPDRPFVLVEPGSEYTVFRIVGWMWGSNATYKGWWDNPNGRPFAWFVPQGRLTDIDTLPEMQWNRRASPDPEGNAMIIENATQESWSLT